MGSALRLLSVGIFSASFLLAQQGQSPVTATATVTADDLLARPVGVNWTSYNGDYTGQRYSKLLEINASNVAQLRAEWVFMLPIPRGSK